MLVPIDKIKTDAESGIVKAQFHLGGLYSKGHRVPKNKKEAFFWYKKAAEQGHAVAQACLGWAYANARGIERDFRQSIYWYRKAAEQRNASAIFYVGQSYALGRGVPRDIYEAIKWQEKAAEMGYCYASWDLGMSYLIFRKKFLDMPNRRTTAYFWLSIALHQGFKKFLAKPFYITYGLTFKKEQKVQINQQVEDWLKNHAKQ